MITTTKEIKTLKQWEKYTKNPKYCNHLLGYWVRFGMPDVCVTCNVERVIS
jgi:hypothetical protein